MSLQEHFENSGNWLFCRRSYLPYLLFLLFIPAIPQIHRPYGSERLQNEWEFVCFAISISGLLMRGVIVGQAAPNTSGRNTHAQVADSLNTTGIYSVVRHPLYLANYLMWLGIALFCFVPWVAVIFSLCFWLYYERIMFAEEEYLRRKFGRTFTDWAAKTPAFIPRLSSWKPAAHPFSMRIALGREYTGLLGITWAFVGMDLFEHVINTQNFSFEIHWIAIGIVSLIIALTLRSLKKCTTILSLPHR